MERLKTGNYQLSIQGVYDLNGNKMVDTTVRFGYKEPEVAQLFDVLITEIMSDPVPSIDLPNVEYLELFNNSDKPINLNNWSIGDASRTVLLDSFALMPQTFVVLCDEKVASAMADFGAVLPVNSMPTLNNSGDSLTLYNSRNQVISHVKYSTDWHRETWKQTGGWSLELRDLTQPCGGRENWNSSRDTRGGTPGALNSINEVNGDFEAPTLTYATITGWQTVELNFSESIMSYHPDVSDFNIIGHQIKEIDMPNYKAIRLTTENKFELGEPYEVLVSNIMDCAGNRLLKERTRIAIPEQKSEKDLLVNEILFNPIKGGVDFVEIYNHGKKILDLSDLFVARKGDQGDWTDFKPVVDRSYLLAIIPLTSVFQSVGTNTISTSMSSANWETISISKPIYLFDEGSFILIGFQSPVVPTLSSPVSKIVCKRDCANANEEYKRLIVIKKIKKQKFFTMALF